MIMRKNQSRLYRIFVKIDVKGLNVFLLLLCSLLILGYVIPTYIIPIPYGTDVYGHLFFTRQMANTNFLSDFYMHCIKKGYLRYDYPFGLWLFGSIVTKITGIGMLELSRIVPFAIMLVLIVIYYSFAKVFSGLPKNYSLLSVIFLLSMPLLCMSILGYSTSKFSMVFVIFILYNILLQKEKILWKQFFFIIIFCFSLCLTHTGTYMFLLSLIFVYLLIYATLYGDLHRGAYAAVANILFIYCLLYTSPSPRDRG